MCVFASLLSWLTGTLRFGEDVHQRTTVDVTAKWGYINFTDYKNPVCSQKVIQADRINWYCWGWFCSSYLWWMLLKSKGYLRFLSTGECWQVQHGKFKREFCHKYFLLEITVKIVVDHLHSYGIWLFEAQKPLRLYSDPEEACLPVSFRMSCRVHFLHFWDMRDCWKII